MELSKKLWEDFRCGLENCLKNENKDDLENAWDSRE
jgi:hypothetical protein